MFAHQVIEDLLYIREAENIKANSSAMKKTIDYLLSHIATCQKFHMGDVSEVLSAVKNIKNVDLKSLKYPYDKIYMDFISPTHIQLSKIAAIIIQNPKGHQIFVLQQEKNRKTWYPSSSYIDYNNVTHDLNVFIRKGIDDENGKIESTWLNVVARLVYRTIVLLTCKNIQVEKILAPTSLNKKRRNAGKQELFDYHVLNVFVPSARREHHEHTEPLSHNRVHLCRGHFKEYTAEHPLFGRLTGLYWWQPHVRGKNRDGIVMKEYNVINKETVTA